MKKASSIFQNHVTVKCKFHYHAIHGLMKGKKSDRNKFTFSEIQSSSSSAGMKRKCKSPQGEATSLSTHDILLTRQRPNIRRKYSSLSRLVTHCCSVLRL